MKTTGTGFPASHESSGSEAVVLRARFAPAALGPGLRGHRLREPGLVGHVREDRIRAGGEVREGCVEGALGRRRRWRCAKASRPGSRTAKRCTSFPWSGTRGRHPLAAASRVVDRKPEDPAARACLRRPRSHAVGLKRLRPDAFCLAPRPGVLAGQQEEERATPATPVATMPGGAGRGPAPRRRKCALAGGGKDDREARSATSSAANARMTARSDPAHGKRPRRHRGDRDDRPPDAGAARDLDLDRVLALPHQPQRCRVEARISRDDSRLVRRSALPAGLRRTASAGR